jgi:hypothetical protein
VVGPPPYRVTRADRREFAQLAEQECQALPRIRQDLIALGDEV